MKKEIVLSIVVCLFLSSAASADTFGTGANEFEIDFVTISGDASSANGTNIGAGKPEGFKDPGEYRIGRFEVTNEQWTKFTNEYGSPYGNPTNAYGSFVYWQGANHPTNCVSWYEAAQFANWLNTSSGHLPAYKFTGTPGTSEYTLTAWDVADAGYNPKNPLRNNNAFYFVPTEDEWVKAAYWNGTSLQTFAAKPGQSVYQGNGSNGGWNFWDGGYAMNYLGPWQVGSGSEELNGTYDMMGNIWEFLESPYDAGDFPINADRATRGGGYAGILGELHLELTSRNIRDAHNQDSSTGFRIASVPESATVSLLAVGGLALLGRRK